MTSKGAKKINLALQGGGAHGAITWGVIDRLLEDDRIEIDSISGASAGSVNAVALAYGLHKGGCEGGREMLDALWREISDVGAIYSPVRRTPLDMALGAFNLDNSLSYIAFDAFTRTLSPYQFNPFGFNPLKDLLEKLIDFDSLKSCDVTQLYLSATNVRSGKVHIFRTKDVSVDVVMASTCLPFLYKAVEIGGEHYWDGGYMGNPVLFPFFYEAESSDVVIVHVNPLERPDVPLTSPDIMNRINEISFNSSLLRELRAVGFVQKLLDDGWIKDEFRDRLRNVHIHSIRSDRALTDLSIASKFNVDWAFLSELKQRGRKIAEDWLAENFVHIGRRSSVDIRAMYDGTAAKD
ncbi:MAG: patatin-like phospholipase family protein [Pseudomonadota bacterium]|nr:patatin-like phospholipase family protein [Pseudomonadota bacterium]